MVLLLSIVGEKLGTMRSADGRKVKVNETFLTTVPYYLIPCMSLAEQPIIKRNSITILMYFINEAFKHYKPIGVATTGNPFFDVRMQQRDLESYLQQIIQTSGMHLLNQSHNNDFGIEKSIKSA